MHKSLFLTAGVAFMGTFMLAPSAALAVSAEAACEAEGGRFFTEGGVKCCAFPVGESDNEKTVCQKGSFASDEGQDETFQNPGGNQPQGQQNQDRIDQN